MASEQYQLVRFPLLRLQEIFRAVESSAVAGAAVIRKVNGERSDKK